MRTRPRIHSHDVGLVNGSDLASAILLGVVESVAGNTLAGLKGNELDALNHTVHDLVLDTRVFSFGVFTDQNSVDVVIGGLETLDGAARADVGKKGEGAAQGKVERNVALADCRREKDRLARVHRLGALLPNVTY